MSILGGEPRRRQRDVPRDGYLIPPYGSNAGGGATICTLGVRVIDDHHVDITMHVDPTGEPGDVTLSCTKPHGGSATFVVHLTAAAGG